MIFDIFVFIQYLILTLEPPRAILDHAKIKQLVRRSPASTLNLNLVRVPTACPSEGVLVDGRQEQLMEQPNGRRIVDVQTVVYFEVDEESLPFGPKTVGNVIPYALNASVVNASTRYCEWLPRVIVGVYLPAPNVRTTIAASVFLHPTRNLDVLSSVIASYSARPAMNCHRIEEQCQNSARAIIIVRAKPHDHSRMAIDKAVNYYLPSDQACNP
jgi:hypothetical protein